MHVISFSSVWKNLLLQASSDENEAEVNFSLEFKKMSMKRSNRFANIPIFRIIWSYFIGIQDSVLSPGYKRYW